MNFAHPLAWLLLVLLVPVTLLYRLRVHAPSQTVGTGLFWQKALAEEKLRWRWRRWRHKASLALQMLIVALIALAAAGPQIPAAKRIVLILDNSATMQSSDVQPWRYGKAAEVGQRLIESLRPCDEMAVVAACAAPIEVQPWTSDPILLTDAIYSYHPYVSAPNEPDALEWAVKLARELFPADETPPRIVLITDGCARQAARNAEKTGVEVLRVGTAAGNVAITRFNARRSNANPAECEVFVELQNHGDQGARGTLSIEVEGKQSKAASEFAVAKDGRWQHIFALNLPTAAQLTARIAPHDVYPFDDTALLDVPAAPAVHREQIPDLLGGQSPRSEPFVARTGGPPLATIADRPPDGYRSLYPPLVPPYCGRDRTSHGTDIRVPSDLGSDALKVAVQRPLPPLWIVPAALAAVLVIFEWCLYQRRWTN